MFLVSKDVDIAVGPERVWRVLMDFEHYRSWHPYVELEGVPALGGMIDFFFRRQPGSPRGWKGDAKVTQFQPTKCFAYRIGIAGIFTLEHAFALQETPDGTRVTYSSTYRGALAAIAEANLRKRLHGLHELPLERFARGFRQSDKSPPAPASKTPKKPRKGFRGY